MTEVTHMADETALRARCAAILSKLQQDALLRQGSPVDDLASFVLAEVRSAASVRDARNRSSMRTTLTSGAW